MGLALSFSKKEIDDRGPGIKITYGGEALFIFIERDGNRVKFDLQGPRDFVISRFERTPKEKPDDESQMEFPA